MRAVLRILATGSMLLSAFMAQAGDTRESSVIETDDGRYVTTLQQNDRGMFLDVTPEDESDQSISRRIPSDCPECGLECLKPPLISFEPNPSGTELGGGGVTVTLENPSRCIRIDGFRLKRDSLIHFLVINGRKEEYRFRVLESGELLFEREVPPGQELKERLVPIGDRRYTLSVSALPDQATELPTQVGFAVYRYENEEDPVQSLVMINFGAGQ